MKIWCLFSIDNEYEQPPNCLRAFWKKKPGDDVLFDIMKKLENYIDEDTFVNACCSKKGFEYRYNDGTEYWLSEICENEIIIG